MEKKHINEILERKVDQIYNAAREEALKEFTVNIADMLSALDLIDQFKLLFAEFKRLDELEQVSEYPFYIHNHANQQNLLNQFSSRAFLLNVDESAILFDCIKLGRIKSEIEFKIDRTARLIPKYTFDDFMNGVPNPFLFELGISKFFDELELHKIMKWQEESVIEAIDWEAAKIIKKVQSKCKLIKEPEILLANELKEIKQLRENNFKTGEELKMILSGLFILKDLQIERWDSETLFYAYRNYMAGRCGHRYLLPSIQTKSKGKPYGTKKLLAPPEATIFGVIHRYTEWINAVVSNKCWGDKYVIFDWRVAITNTYAETRKRIELKVDEMGMQLKKIPEDRREQFLFEQFNYYRIQFNNFQQKKYFEFWTGLTSDEYFRKYTAYGFYEAAPLQQIKHIGEAIFIQKMARIVNSRFMGLANDHIDDYIKMEEFVNEIPTILSHMVYTKEFYKYTMFYGNPFYDEYWYYGLPLEMMQFNFRDSLEAYLQSVMNKLEDVLKNAEQSKGVLYLHSRLKQMRLRNLDYQEYRFSDKRHKIRSKYSDQFKEYLEIEAEFIAQTKDISVLSILPKSKTKVETFDSIFPNEKGALVLNLLEEMKLTVNGVCKISPRKKSSLRGVAEALIESKVAPPLSLESIYMVIAGKIGLEIQSKLDWSGLGDSYKKQALSILRGS